MTNKDVLRVVHYDSEKVIVKVKEMTNLEAAMFPWLNKNWDYITITRGKQHVMRFILKDGNDWNISWGDRGCDCLSDSLRESRNKIVNFIQEECFIPLNIDSENYTFDSLFVTPHDLYSVILKNENNENIYVHISKRGNEQHALQVAKGYCGGKALSQRIRVNFGWKYIPVE